VNNIPIGGTTGLCHETTAAIDEAARWLAEHRQELRQQLRPIIPALRERFGLSNKDAILAAVEAVRYERRPG
jgi:hypothetical protein